MKPIVKFPNVKACIFSCDAYEKNYLDRLTDKELLTEAMEATDNCDVIDSLEEFQAYVNGDTKYDSYQSLDNSFVYFVNVDEDEDNGSKDEEFAKQFSRFVNGRMRSPKRVAEAMACEHRYLQGEMYKVCMEYTKALAENYEKGRYDARNEGYCKLASEIADVFSNELY